MMTTEKLYFQDPYQIEFTANVIDYVQVKGKIGLILDRTAFYPTSGGQPHDTGYLNIYPVIDVIEEGDEVVHVIEGEYQGEQQLSGIVEWQRRFDHMQQHAGQHILSAVILKEYGWETVGFHLGNEYVTIDVTTSEEIPFLEIENKVYEIIMHNLPIKTHFKQRFELDSYVTRKVPQSGDVIRIVEIPDIDQNACCGTHPIRTSEVGMIKLLSTELVRGYRRIYFIAGWRAFARFQQEHQTLSNIAMTLKTNQKDVEQRLLMLKVEHEQLQKENRRLGHELIHWETVDWKRKYRPLGNFQLYIHTWEGRSFQELKDLAKVITEQDQAIVIFATLQLKAQVVLACSQNVPFSMLELANVLADHIRGRGGGNHVFAQVGGEAASLKTALEALEMRLQQLNETVGLGQSSVEKEV